MRRKSIIILLYTFISCGLINNQKNTDYLECTINPIYSIKVTTVADKRFGHQIYKNDTLVIDQYLIPAVPGTSGFISKKQAKIVAELVVEKLSNGIFPPNVKVTELDDMKIDY